MRIRWLPNALSVTRIVLVPAWLAVAIAERSRALDGLEVRRAPILALLLVIGLSDYFDGLIARRFGLTSAAGATMDATADKLATLTASTFLAFFAEPAFTALPIWFWAVLVVRDAILATGYLALKAKGRAVDSSHLWEGRLATALLFVVVVLACAAAPKMWVTAGAVAICALAAIGTWQYVNRGVAQWVRPRGLSRPLPQPSPRAR